MTLEPRTLEEFIENQCGMVTPKLLELLEPHRKFVETHLRNFFTDNPFGDFDENAEIIWQFLPEPADDDFNYP